MPASNADPTLSRLLRHMAWANAKLIGRLGELTDADLGLTAPRNEWSAGRILEHLVNAAGNYAARLEGLPRQQPGPSLTSTGQLGELAARAAAVDARLLAQAALPDGPAMYADQPDDTPARSTVLAQAIHHATEHRAQIAGALATNGNGAVDLDAIDLWEYADAEALRV